LPSLCANFGCLRQALGLVQPRLHYPTAANCAFLARIAAAGSKPSSCSMRLAWIRAFAVGEQSFVQWKNGHRVFEDITSP
jgi:hypothetical protein